MPRKHKGMHQGALSFLAYDVLETHCGEWFTSRQLTREVARIRGLPYEEVAGAVHRALERMKTKGLVEVTVVKDKGGFGHGPSKTWLYSVPTRDYWHQEETA